jgi:PhzF family phenazine biosynthesis protein
MGLTIYQVDAFTDRPFAGNPAAVCILDEYGEDSWMQSVAMEMNLSETAFLVRREDGLDLRWFTPTREVPLCGHATLASAHILWETGHLGPGEDARFSTLSGPLGARRSGDWIEMDFPAEPEQEPVDTADVERALGASVKHAGKNRMYYLAEVDSAETVRSLKPDIALVDELPTQGITVTSVSDSPEYDFISRFFAPQSGVNEDPVTGSAHCLLGPHWEGRLGRHEFVAYQASPRGGVVRVRLEGDRVYLGGQAVTVLRGELLA